MANIKSAKKRARQDVKRRLHNGMQRHRGMTGVKKARTAIENKTANAADIMRSAMRELDMLGNKGIFHKNKVARLKSRLVAAFKAHAV